MIDDDIKTRRLEASDLVDEIRIMGGGALPADIEFVRQHRPGFLRSYYSLQEQVGQSAKLFSDELNRKNTHFIYELIQNADDNKYKKGVEPLLRFTLEEDRLIVDANETGFTYESVAAISRLRGSTKFRKTGFIGEKGIGFRSVFRVARKVHIQSEPFSFAFIHEAGDNGMGMVTPLNESHGTLPEGVQTRMILHLRDGKDLESIKTELQSLPRTLLLFLRKLRRLEVNITLKGFDDWNIFYSLKQTEGFNSENRLTITRATAESSTEHHFWIKRRMVYEMPDHASRPQIDQAEVILAFPLDHEEEPIIEKQWISAYLPVSQVDFKFLIQSDFITAANRNDVLDCAWNERLLGAVVQAFVSAAEDQDGFLCHSRLRFSWVRFIPTSRIAHQPWCRLQENIIQQVEDRRLFFSHNCSSDANRTDDGQHRWLAKQLRIVGEQYRDGSMAPLLPDLDRGPTTYISEHYDVQLDLPVLRKLGTADLSTSPGFLTRLSRDLNNNDSRWKSTDFASDWFTRVARLLLVATEDLVLKKAIQKLPLVPLKSGRWVTSLTASAFLPSSGEMMIPEGLSLNLVSDVALSNLSLKDLLMGLGIGECPPGQVISLIEQRYAPRSSLDRSALVQDIVFLFWHHDMIPKTKYNIYLSQTKDGTQYFWNNVEHGGWLYEPKSEHPLALSKLLLGGFPTSLKEKFSFVRHDYFESLAKCGIRHGKVGSEWLRQRAGIKITPQLLSRKQKSMFDGSPKEMSQEFKFVAENMPQYLLRILKHEYFQLEQSEEWDGYIKACEVPVLNCPKERLLEATFLPLPTLLNSVHELGLSDGFGFLEELDGIKEVESVKWDFLKRFGVGVKADVHFWVTVLRHAAQCQDVQKTSVFKIYARLQAFIDDEDMLAVLISFVEANLIYVPSSNEQGEWEWVGLQNVVWNGPEWFTMLQPLNNIPEYKLLVSLFVNTLGVSDITIKHCLNHLGELSTTNEHHKASLLYSKLAELWQSENRNEGMKDQIKSQFEDERLIWDPSSQEWYSPSSCIWAEHTIILPNKVSLASTYKEHLVLFRDVLDIRKPSVEMHIASLVDKAAEDPDKSSIIQEMRNISALNPAPEILRTRVGNCPCFPIRETSGEVVWLPRKSSFAIVDRKEYATMFAGKIRSLDFSLEEVHSVSRFLSCLGLDEKLLSFAVTEETNVEDSLPAGGLTRNLKSKAYAIARYAAHLRAPDPLTIFERLLKLEVFTSSKILRTCSIKLGTRTTSVPTDTAYFHLDASNGPLKLYISADEERQEVCLMRHLPNALLRHFGAITPRRGAELGAILTARSPTVVDTILEQDGVIDVVGICKQDSAELDRMMPGTDSNADLAVLATTSFDTMQSSSFARAIGSGHPDIAIITDHHRVLEEDQEAAIDRIEQPDLYRQLIAFVIEQANLIQNLPAKGSSVRALQSSESASDRGLAPNFSHCQQGSRQIGAVGELFVFTLLEKLALPNFTQACWRSTIRHLVSVHEIHRSLGQWFGTETSDIVYSDDENKLTRLLIQQGYLTGESWADRTPTYYIEVKTTMGDEARPFYCSQAQFDRMEANELPDNGDATNEVYLIARVFGLGGSRMGLKLYLDPWKMRRNRELRFEAQVYSVTPH